MGGEGGGVLVNQAPHQIDLLQWICGMPKKVSSNVKYGYQRDIAVEDDVTAVLTTAMVQQVYLLHVHMTLLVLTVLKLLVIKEKLLSTIARK